MIVVESAARINAWGVLCPNHGQRGNQFLTREARVKLRKIRRAIADYHASLCVSVTIRPAAE